MKNLADFVILWRKEERIISAGRLLVNKNGRVKLLENYSLYIVNLDMSDSGKYFCEIDVFGQTLILKHHLDVLVPPRIISWEKSVTVLAGERLDLVCTAQGNPKPKLSWNKYSTGKELLPPPGTIVHFYMQVLKNLTSTKY